jgi:predicted dehydrogenase
MTDQPLRVGFAGAVRHAGQYARLLTEDPRVRIVGMTDHPEVPQWITQDGKALCRTLGVPWIGDPAELLQPAAVDLVIVCSEPTRHAGMVIDSLTAGLHTCCDKPVATDTAAADAVVRAAEHAGRVCTVVNRTFAPSLRRMRSWVDAGALGLPRHVDVEFLTSSAAMGSDVERADLVVDPALSGGGEMRNFLGYAVDAIRYLTGLEISEVYAETGALFDGPHEAHGVEDTAVVSLQLEHGVTATATVSRSPAVPTLGSAHSSIRLIGSHGHATVDDETPRVIHFGPSGAAARPVDGGGGAQAVTAFFDDLIRCVTLGRHPAYTVQDARTGVAVIDAAYRSAETGQPVGVDA